MKTGVEKIDTDWFSDDRKTVRNYLYTKKGLYCCDIVTFNTIDTKGAIRDICRGLARDNIDNLPQDILAEVQKWDKIQKENKSDVAVPYPKELQKKIVKHSIHKEIPIDYLNFSNKVIDMYEADEASTRKKYPELFYYVDLVIGVVVSVGNHPSACVVSPYPVDEAFGTFTTSTNEYPISVINMKEIDSLNFVKLDILG